MIKNDEIFAITRQDSLVKWNILSGESELMRTKVTSVAKDQNGILLITSSSLELMESSDGETWKEIDKIPSEGRKIHFDSRNRPLVIHQKGIYYNDENHWPNKKCRVFNSFEDQDGNPVTYFQIPDYSFMDSKDRVWLTFNGGEWGPDICFFDAINQVYFPTKYFNLKVDYDRWTNSSRYEKDVIQAHPDEIRIIDSKRYNKFPSNLPFNSDIKSIYEDPFGNYYIAQSTMHFGLEGSITKLNACDIIDFYSKSDIEVLDFYEDVHSFTDKKGDQEENRFKTVTECLGPLNYNSYDGFIYYFTNNGFFKLFEGEKASQKELIFNPKIIWKEGLPNAVGYQMAVKKFEFINNNDFVFLTNLDGIGYFSENSITFFR
ncbi:hypothetical protein [Winogradskyella aurantiaca]|uniref:hypothetical protein n=1 Tax=Winogradskyella aurantiaca TaxID=2219558 RepID=UPI0018E5A420|nr:hypothetical protein [Winogradskyella aurantiaca]